MGVIFDAIETAAIAVGGIFGGALSRVAADDLKAWAPVMAERLVVRAARRLPTDVRDRMFDEWRADVLLDTPGSFPKLWKAAGFVIAARRISRDKARAGSGSSAKLVEGVAVYGGRAIAWWAIRAVRKQLRVRGLRPGETEAAWDRFLAELQLRITAKIADLVREGARTGDRGLIARVGQNVLTATAAELALEWTRAGSAEELACEGPLSQAAEIAGEEACSRTVSSEAAPSASDVCQVGRAEQ